jgi:CMP-N,N'-diacetyllegionaminic acid synthase
MGILVTICARGGSKGIPGKNIKPIGGTPLIGHSIKVAQRFLAQNEGIMELSTDNAEIKDVARSLGLATEYTRPPKLASDTAGKIDVLYHVWKYAEKKHGQQFDYLLDLDVSAPLRSLEDVQQAFKMLKADKKALNIFSVSKAHRNPYFNMVEKKRNGYYGVIKKGEFKTRQQSPPVFDMNASFYIYKRAFFEQGCTSAITPKSLIYAMDHICFDLDEPLDLSYMNFLLENRLLDFKFDY